MEFNDVQRANTVIPCSGFVFLDINSKSLIRMFEKSYVQYYGSAYIDNLPLYCFSEVLIQYFKRSKIKVLS